MDDKSLLKKAIMSSLYILENIICVSNLVQFNTFMLGYKCDFCLTGIAYNCHFVIWKSYSREEGREEDE